MYRTALAFALVCASTAHAASISLIPPEPEESAAWLLVKLDADETWLVGEVDGSPMDGWVSLFTPDETANPVEWANWPEPQFWILRADPEAYLRPEDDAFLFADHDWSMEVAADLDEFVLIPLGMGVSHDFRIEEGAYARSYNPTIIPEPSGWVAALYCLGLWWLTGQRGRS